MAEPPIDIDHELMALETELKRLEAEYNMFFAGRLPRPPWETRGRVNAMVKRLDRMRLSNYGARFRFSTIQARYSAFIDLWDRGLRSREDGRGGGPFVQSRPIAEKVERPKDRVLFAATFNDPQHQMDKLHELHDRLTEARRKTGEDAIPFQSFAQLIETQVGAFKEKGSREVAFSVAVKNGRVAFTARAKKGRWEPT